MRIYRFCGFNVLHYQTLNSSTNYLSDTMPPDKECFYLVGAGGAGVNYLANLLNKASNAICEVKPLRSLSIESRHYKKGNISHASEQVAEFLSNKAECDLNAGVFGESHDSLGHFIPEIAVQSDAKFVFVHQDGRDYVRFWMDWHNLKYGNVYRECAEHEEITPTAISKAARLPLPLDQCDYFRSRPGKDEQLNETWLDLSREEMVAYHWAYTNSVHLNNLRLLSAERWVQIDYSNPQIDDIKKIIDFLELDEVDPVVIEQQLSYRLRIEEQQTYPEWCDWNSGQRDKFWNIASSSMESLGYIVEPSRFWKPAGFGAVWQNTSSIGEWYKWMYEGRIQMHQAFFDWVKSTSKDGLIDSIADFGSGIGYGYTASFADKRYVGFDISEKAIEFANTNNENPLHEFMCIDYMCEDIQDKYDVVHSSGTIDNCYDIDQYLKAMVNASKGWVYISCYRGWFPHLNEHIYRYNKEQKCFYNDVSPRKVRCALNALGCEDIQIHKLPTQNSEIPYETVITAKV